MPHLPDQCMEVLTDLILDNIPEGQSYVFVTGDLTPNQDTENQTDFDFLSNIPKEGAAQVMREVADAIDPPPAPPAYAG